MAEHDEQTRVMLSLSDLRGDLRTAMAEITGELKVLRAQNAGLEQKVDGLAEKVQALDQAKSSYVTRKDVDRRVRNGTAVAGVLLAVLTLVINTAPALLLQ